MTGRTIYINVWTLVLSLFTLAAEGQTMVYLERSESLSFDQERIPDAQILRGNVVFRHDNALMYCDSAYFYEYTNSLDAFGHVRFVQGDTLRGYGDKLFYDGNTKLARMRRNVRLVHGRENENPTILTTDSLNYNRQSNIAYYYTGGTIQDTLNTLTSIRGTYSANTKQAVFSKQVVLVNKKFTLKSDTLLYNTKNKITDIVSPTEIVYEKETNIHTSRGWYNTNNEQSMLLDRSIIKHTDGQTITGDTIYYDKRIGFGQIFGQMEMCDSTQHATLFGNYGEIWETDSRGYATDSALMIDWSDSAHIAYIHADTLFTEELHYLDSVRMADSTQIDSTYRRVRAHHGVRVYRNDMQMVCDSLVYLGNDSTIHLYTNPICWSENQQISADSIVVYIVNGTVNHAIGTGNALCVMEDSIDYYNQMSGKEITAYLHEGEVYMVDMSGNALTIYFPKEEDGEYIGMNTTESSYIRVFITEQEIERIRFTKETTGILYPMDQIPDAGNRLSQFFWAYPVRPINAEDVFRRVQWNKTTQETTIETN